jgi:hypothetical protein
MKTPSITPYLLPPDNSVRDAPWTLGDDRPLPDRLEHWDPFTDVEFFRVVETDLDAVREACRLGPDATFAVVVSWHSSRTRHSEASIPVELGSLRGVVTASASLRVAGAGAGGRLDLRTRLILRSAGSTPSPISPQREGAVLWTDETRVSLEGSASRFPVSPVDFSAVPRLPDGGSWALEWESEDLDAPVLSAMRLIVNSSDLPLLQALRSGSSDARSEVVRSFVLFDVARTLVETALREERFVDDPESFEEGSVGRMLFEFLSVCWPGIPIAALRSRSQNDPSRLGAELQQHLGLLR